MEPPAKEPGALPLADSTSAPGGLANGRAPHEQVPLDRLCLHQGLPWLLGEESKAQSPASKRARVSPRGLSEAGPGICIVHKPPGELHAEGRQLQNAMSPPIPSSKHR